jgi:hypothetical protein
MRKIERLRADHPMWGKRKLAVLLRREGIDVSVSMVGRILTKRDCQKFRVRGRVDHHAVTNLPSNIMAN